MDASALAYLQYAQRSLADAGRMSPALTEEASLEISRTELMQGALCEHSRIRLRELAQRSAASKDKNQKAGAGDDDEWPIRVLVIPKVFSLRPDHGRPSALRPAILTPLLLSASVDREGNLQPEDVAERQAILSRDLLEPTRFGVTIGSVEDADCAYAQYADKAESWSLQMGRGVAILEATTKSEYEHFAIEDYELRKSAYIVLAESGGATWAIQRLTEHLLRASSADAPLFECLTRAAADRALLDADSELQASLQHLGQMESRYGLSPSQREALAHHLALDEKGKPLAELLAVDGPPGTGKTTLLLSVIASAWVKGALEGGEPPLIVATSTNNQAVTNILKAFSAVDEGTGPLAGRWLTELKSYGLYIPAKTRKEHENFPVHELRGDGAKATFDAKRYEDATGLEQACEEFLSHARPALGMEPSMGLDEAVTRLQAELKGEVQQIRLAVAALARVATIAGGVTPSAVDAALHRLLQEQGTLEGRLQDVASRVQNLLRLQQSWAEHQLQEPVLVQLLAWFGLGGRRNARSRAFWARQMLHMPSPDVHVLREVPFAQVEAQRAVLELQARQSGQQVRAQFEEVQRRRQELQVDLQYLQPLLGDQPLSIPAVQATLDVQCRYRAFKLATHYWEGRYLLEVQAQLREPRGLVDSKSPVRLLAQYRRLAKLHPCFVSTLYTLPSRFIAFNGEQVPLWQEIDLLIADEAGQVSPEIAAVSFALAKRAIVVGDVDQIEPIWSVPRHIDLANAQQAGVAVTGVDAFSESGMAASSGSLMKMAQRATPFSRFPERGRGMFLSEHRRCWKEIIELCNELVYEGRLQPQRIDDGVRCIQPSLGYVHIPGTDVRRGGSRENELEAQAIARWIRDRRGDIEDAYAQHPLGELVAVVTPFAAQARRILRELDQQLGAAHGITVGTVHALQGAERRIVIFSPCHGLNTVPGSTFIDRNRSMLNVAISRAQDAFLVFGNMHLFRPEGRHPCAIIGRSLFARGSEVAGVSAELLLPAPRLGKGRLVADLEGHRALLDEALATARRTLVIVSPFLTEDALDSDPIERGIQAATRRGVKVRVVTDSSFGKAPERQACVRRLERAGAKVRVVTTQGVHSKLLLVDRAWFAIGSFNWLSAVRRVGDRWARYESSLRYDGDESFAMISRSLEDIARLLDDAAATQHNGSPLPQPT